jgi:dihydroflavonol-4-reductase
MRVLVTGANGHIGLNLCRGLLDRGHAVRASVRSLADPGKTSGLRTLSPIDLVEVDLYRPEQLRAALSDIDVFFHLAAVYAYVVKGAGGADAQIVRPSVEGASHAIRSAADAGVRKVVLTSSIVTLPLTRPGAPPSTERDWTTDLRVPYVRAKTLAEQRAWELARDLSVHLVTVLPGAVCGAGFSRNTPSIDIFEGIMLGTMRFGAPDANFPYVDIRDVVLAHVLAGEQDCMGRFIACNDHLPSFLELIAAMHRIDPSVPLTTSTIPRIVTGAAPFFDWLNHKLIGSPRVMTADLVASVRDRVWNASNARIRRELGWSPTVPLETSLGDMMEAIRANRARRSSGPPAAPSG